MVERSKTQFQEDDLVWIVDPQVIKDKFHLGRILKSHYTKIISHDLQIFKQNWV